MARLSLLLPGALALVLSPPYERSIPRDAPLEALALIDVREATLPPPIGRTRATLHVPLGELERRAFELPNTIEGDKVEAFHRNGVLMLRLPKAPEHQPRRIAVNPS